ncbi:hypothetical protein ACO1O0_005271 [Amphichorda felina]
MSGLVNIGSAAEWQSLLSGTNVVIADFYADWCGPCKMIAPHFERLAKEHSRPKKVAFAKVNVDNQSTIAQSNGVSAMPTFKIFHNGNCIETIKGADPSALSAAISKAVKLADSPGGGKPGAAFKTPGRTLGSDAPVAARRGPSFDIGKLFSMLVSFLDAYKAAENSQFNIHRRVEPKAKAKGTASSANGSRPPQKPAFRTLADLGSE